MPVPRDVSSDGDAHVAQRDLHAHRVEVSVSRSQGVLVGDGTQVNIFVGQDPASAEAEREALGSVADADFRSDGFAPSRLGRTLPRDTAAFTGRAAELEQLNAALDEAQGGVLPVFAVDGIAGAGKSAFAIHAAHCLAARFPDGQVFLPLHAHTPATPRVSAHAALATLLLGDGLDPRKLPDDSGARAALWRKRTAGRCMLLVLDDAADSAQVTPLLPAAPGTLVLVTSRRRLDGLDDVIPLSLSGLPPVDAARLIVRLARRRALDHADPKIAELADLCGFLPLTLSICAARLASRPSFTVADLLTRFASTEDRLGALTGGERSVAAALELSYQDLDQSQRRLLRLLGAHPGTSYEPEATAALLDADVGMARILLDALEGHRLLDETTPGRYRMHDLVREYAAGAARHDPQEADAALSRLLRHYIIRSSARGCDLGWLRTERETLLSCIDYAYQTGRHVDMLRLSDTVWPLLETGEPWSLAVAAQARVLDVYRKLGDQNGQASALTRLGDVRMHTHICHAAATAYTEALVLYRQLGMPHEEAAVSRKLGMARRISLDTTYATDVLKRSRGRELEAEAGYAKAMERVRQFEDRRERASALRLLGLIWLHDGRDEEAAMAHAEILELYARPDDGRAAVLSKLGQAWQCAGRYKEAEAAYTEALPLVRDDRPFPRAVVLTGLGMALWTTSRFPEAEAAYTQALELLRHHGHRRAHANVLTSLAQVLQDTGRRAEADAAFAEALALYRQHFRQHSDDDQMLKVLHNLRKMREEIGDYPAAEALRDEEKRIREQQNEVKKSASRSSAAHRGPAGRPSG